MDCREARERIEVQRRGAHVESAAEVEAHLRRCPACRAYQADVRRIRSLLQAEAVPPMPADLPDRALRRLRQGRGRWGPTSMAACLVLAAGVVLGAWLQPWERTLQVDSGGAPEGGEWRSRVVTLSLDSPRELSSVEFRLVVPPSAEVQGHPGRRTLEWTDDLAEGPNQLRVPLLLRGEADGELVATLTHEGRSRNLRVPLSELAAED